ncbi:MAG: stationary-phase-induced ribosome-associated protein [Hafnia sp.]|uniref:stationary-phase-induced ribosome-associated protein n=1 Tax=Hafnia sp. TaxID=1873498 RepID=UPI002FC9A2C8
MANRTANRKARRLLGLDYKLSNKPNDIVFPFCVPVTSRWKLSDNLQSHDVVAVKSAPYMLCGMPCVGYAYYPVIAFYPAYVAKQSKRG